MPLSNNTKLTRIAVFYDGNYFLHVSNYYAFNHVRNSRLSLRGLHEFIRTRVSDLEDTEMHLCQIVDSHFFRGRISANEAQQRGNLLYYDRVFEDILMWEGVITHYLPLRNTGGRREDKGIDVWMALEAYELTLLKKFDVVVLITSDGNYVPLVRKMNNLGARIMVLSWDFEFVDNEGKHVVTRTSHELLNEVTYPVQMHDLIESRSTKDEEVIQNLFVRRDDTQPRPPRDAREYQDMIEHRAPRVEEDVKDDSERFESYILSMKNGYGFIKYPPNNLFFHASDMLNADFQDLREGDPVEFALGLNRDGDEVAKRVKLIFEDDTDEAEPDDAE